MRCKIYKQIKDINKLVVPKLDSLSKHVGHHHVLVAMLGVKMGDHYLLKKQFMWLMKSFIFLKVFKQCCNK